VARHVQRDQRAERRTYVSVDNPKGAIDWGTTSGNMAVNAGFNTAFCGSGNASLGAAAPTVGNYFGGAMSSGC
jgi:hypothetical protein